jgi:hypothetical protein
MKKAVQSKRAITVPNLSKRAWWLSALGEEASVVFITRWGAAIHAATLLSDCCCSSKQAQCLAASRLALRGD